METEGNTRKSKEKRSNQQTYLEMGEEREIKRNKSDIGWERGNRQGKPTEILENIKKMFEGLYTNTWKQT